MEFFFLFPTYCSSIFLYIIIIIITVIVKIKRTKRVREKIKYNIKRKQMISDDANANQLINNYFLELNI